MIVSAHLPVIQVIIPLIAAPVCSLLPKSRIAWIFTSLISVATFLVSIAITLQVNTIGLLSYNMGNWPAPWGISYYIDHLSALLLVLISAIACITLISSRALLEQEIPAHKRSLFYTAFLLCMTGLLGIVATGDAFNVFVFLEISSLSAYALIAMGRNRKALMAAYQYLIMGTIGATFILIGKAGLMPFHRWLPSAMVAPTPVSALLHAVAVVKAGVFCVLKISVYIFGLDVLHATGASTAIIWLATLTMLLASLVAIQQDNLKARLAYSTISQLAYIVLGAALATTVSMVGASLHLVTHAVGKITLFFCAGAIYTASKKTNISDMQGIGYSMPITMTAYTIAALSIIGLPPLAGSWSKWFLIDGALSASHVLIAGAFLVSTLLNIVYLMPISIQAFSLKPNANKPRLQEAPKALLLPLSVTAISCLALFFLMPYIYHFLQSLD